ncbi:beta-lactamase family protein [Skermania sp. ID1734]|uniref:serine hydrolase domain-containing protein n=1 Tax=Skermania sp. ID1734 TaxID=2597516 RepID=UPI00117E720B|nr:serine hydrolase domain-containing protein [Skermania sp. ID1734]TSE01610.1 beta-lactamase family protein [Skermania sp. ID1734]
MSDNNNRYAAVRRAWMARISALLSVGVLAALSPTALAAADPGPSPSPKVTADSAETLLSAAQGGQLLGVPPLRDLVAGAGAKFASPEYWNNWVYEALQHNKYLLPDSVDPVKPDVFLPHAQIDAGPTASPLLSAFVDLRDVTYQYDGRTKKLADFLNDDETDSITFVHNGKLVGQYFANGWRQSEQHQAWSVTKSFVSAAVGIALDQGRIASLDDPINTYVPELAGTAWQGTTIRNILEMRSGIKWDEEAQQLQDNSQFMEWIDMSLYQYSNGRLGKTRNQYLRSLPRVEPQGAHFSYDSANPQVLAWMLEKLYHQSFAQILSDQLWKPLGMEAPAFIMTDSTGAAVASEELFARPNDMARFGEMMRNDGVNSQGRRILSAAYIREATTDMKQGAKDTGDAPSGGYGYQWWQGPTPDSFQANGFQGNYITVQPSQCLTGVRLGHTIAFDSTGTFADQANPEWSAVFRAVAARLGGCPH